MKVFWIGPYLPANGKSGGDLRSYNLIRELKRHGTEMSGFFLGEHSDDARRFFDDIVVRSPSSIGKWLRAIWARFGRVPLSYGRYFDPLISQLIPTDSIVYIDHLHMCVNGPTHLDIPVWIDEHNIEFVLWRDFAGRYSGLRHYLFNNEAELVREYELEQIYRADGVGLPSSAQFDELPAECQQKIRIIPNGVSDEWIEDGARRLNDGLDSDITNLGFIGGFDWAPNRLGVQEFLDTVWTQVTEEFPYLKFWIAGRNTKSTWDKYNNVRVMGEINESADFFDRVDLMVVPLSIGSGTRLKILESCARAIPVVSTEKGAQGLTDLTISTADSISTMTNVVRDILMNSSVMDTVNQNHQTVKSDYSWERIGNTLWNSLSEIDDL